MKVRGSVSSRFATLSVLLFVTVAGAVAQDVRTRPRPDARSRDTDYANRGIPSGQKAKVKGRITRRDADTLSIRDERNVETIVLLNGNTSVKSKGGFFRWGKNYETTSLLRGLLVEVEGVGNQNGELVADKIRFDSSDLKMAQTAEWRVAPVEDATQRLSGQVGELEEISKAARNEAGRAHERISALDDYDVQDSVVVYFRTNSAVVAPEYKRALDQLAEKAAKTKGYVIEIAGYADSTGDAERNRILSQRRADAVVHYLEENHDIPLRRMITPYGFGERRPVADNASMDGRRQNRRVEVKILVNRGIAQSGS
ncbi:MAG TPA: OmpA family protein [Blastocatellia bacterium]|nr:OmpA family protein [Blastocatellia bacterium]